MPFDSPPGISQSGTGAKCSISQLNGLTAPSHLSPINNSRLRWRARATWLPDNGYGKLKPFCVLNICAYQVRLLQITRPPDSQVLTATSTPCCPQLPNSSSQTFSRWYCSRVIIQHDPCKLIVSTRSPFCLALYSPQYWKCIVLSKR